MKQISIKPHIPGYFDAITQNIDQLMICSKAPWIFRLLQIPAISLKKKKYIGLTEISRILF
jgi:hypothetical protein